MPLIVESLTALSSLQKDWEEVYAADPDAQIFLSWSWMETWLGKAGFEWFVLAAREKGSRNYVAFFPLQILTDAGNDLGFHNEIKMGGSEYADYTGLLCKPQFEEEAINAFADYIKTMHWRRFHLWNLRASDRRVRLLMKAFPASKFNTKDVDRLDAENIDSNIYPYVTLSGDWDAYCNTQLSSNTRQKVRRFLRKIDDGGDLRITDATTETLDRDFNILVQFWEQKWAGKKGDRLPGIRNNNRLMIRSSFAAGALFFPVMWKGETPVAAHALLLDRQKTALHFLIGGRDESFNSPPPGFILHAYGLRWAAQNGFVTYDFLQGNEDYKYLFGAKDRHIKCLIVSTKTNRNLGDRLDEKSLSVVFDRTKALHDKGELALAERGYRQLIEADPNHQRALYLLAQLLSAKRDYSGAEDCLKAFLTLQPRNHEGWFQLGRVYQAKPDPEAAIRAYKKVLELDPANRDAASLLAELSPKPNPLRHVLGAGPSWARTDDDDDLLKRLRSK